MIYKTNAMKKYLKLLMVALFATLSFSLVSCGDDDDDNGPLVGTWENYWVDPEDGWQYYTVLQINKNNTFACSEVEVTASGNTYTDNLTGTYEVSGDVKKGAAVTMHFIDEDGDTWTEAGYVRVDGKKLYVSLDGDDEMVYTKK